jgi:hypothetical protein
MFVEYKKDLRHNYMVIAESEDQKIEPYCIKMLEYQSIDGILPLEQRRMDNQILFYYDITAKQSMINLFDKTVLTFDRVKKLMGNVLHPIEKAYEHLLPEDDFILSPEYIYLDVNTNRPYLCFYCGYHKNIKEQMNGLIEYLMNKVDYNDKEAVLLVYQLYAVSKEEGFTFDHLLAVLKKETHEALENKFSKIGITNNENLLERDYQGSEKLFSEINPRDYAIELNEKIMHKDDNQQNQLSMNKPKDIKPKNIKLKDNKSKVRKPKDMILMDILPKEMDRLTKRKTIFHEIAPEKHERKGIGMPVMMEKLEGEEEIPCYPLKTYLYTGACILGGVIITVLGFASKILYNTFGNRIDYSKLFALFLIAFCVEGYLLKIIWDKKNQITKLVMKKEYIDPRQELDNIGTILTRRTPNVNITENVQINQWESNFNQVNKDYQVKLGQHKINAEAKKAKINMEEQLIEEDEYNPTCLLNESSDKTTLILKSLEESNFKNIIINDFPFFIGKLKKNVDYCLEKDVVSRFHAKITKEQEQYYLTDMNSKNGTFVNQEVLQTYQKREIKLGDEIAFANIRYRFMQQNG